VVPKEIEHPRRKDVAVARRAAAMDRHGKSGVFYPTKRGL